MSTAALSPRPGWPESRLLALLLVVALPLLAFEVLSVIDLRQAREAETHEEASRLLDLVQAEQTRIVEDVHHVLVALTEMGIGRMDAPTCRRIMARLKQTYPAYLALNVAAKDGPIWCSTESSAVGKSVADRPYRQEALHTDGVVTDPYILSRTTGRPAIAFARAYLGEDGAPAGSVAALLDIVWLEHYLAQKSLPEHAAVLIADSTGTILARVPEVPGLSGQALPERFQPLLQRTTKGIVEQPGVDGVPRVITYSPVGAGASDLYLQVSLDKAVAMRAVNAATLRSLLLFLGLLSLAGFGATWGVRRFLRVRDQAQQNALRTAAVLASTVDGVIEFDRAWRFTEMVPVSRTDLRLE